MIDMQSLTCDQGYPAIQHAGAREALQLALLISETINLQYFSLSCSGVKRKANFLGSQLLQNAKSLRSKI